MSDPVRDALQSLAAYLFTTTNGLDWKLESFTLRDSYGSRPCLTAETVALGHDIRLCARAWGADQFRVALRISHGLNQSSASDGRRAPPERQREPNVVTPAITMPIPVSYNAVNWDILVTELLTKGRSDLLSLADDLGQVIAKRARATSPDQ